MSELRPVRCPECGKLLFKAAGNFDIEIHCRSLTCRGAFKLGGSLVRRLTYPNPIGSKAKAQ